MPVFPTLSAVSGYQCRFFKSFSRLALQFLAFWLRLAVLFWFVCVSVTSGKMKRKKTEFIVVHCAATSPKMDIGIKEIEKWHKARGFDSVGYHVVIRRDGTRELGRGIDEIGAHVKGYNYNSIGVCLVGGIDENGKSESNFTPEQFEALWNVLGVLTKDYPFAEVVGHRDLNAGKDCPCFDVKGWFNGKLNGE